MGNESTAASSIHNFSIIIQVLGFLETLLMRRPLGLNDPFQRLAY